MVNKSLIYISIILFLIGFIYDHFIVLGISILIIGLLLLSKWWINTGKKHVKVKVSSKEKASYIGNPLQVTYTLENRAIIPFPNIRLVIRLHRNVEVRNIPIYQTEGYYHLYELVFSLPPRSRSSQTVSCQINRRGNYLLGDVDMIHTDPFSFNTEVIDFFQAFDINIYPALHPIPALPQQQLLLRTDGRRKAKFPWLEERILPKGAREYHWNDPFYKIDWKQTGKTGRLFTKQYEHSMKQEIWILGNLRTSDEFSLWSEEEKIESVLSAVASFAYFFSKIGVSYHILFNAKLLKKNDVYHLKANKKDDLRNILYELAKLRSYTTVDFTHLFRMVRASVSFHPTILVISAYLSESLKKVVARYQREKYQVIWINPVQEKTEGNHDESLEPMDNTDVKMESFHH